MSRLARLCCWRQKFDVYNERLSSSLFSIQTGVGGRKRFRFQHRSAFRLLVDVLLFSFQGSYVSATVSTATLISYQNLIVMSTKSFAYSFTSLRLNQQLNKYISLAYKCQCNSSINYINIEIVITLAIPGTPKKAISKP